MLHKPQGVVVYLSSLINSSPPHPLLFGAEVNPTGLTVVWIHLFIYLFIYFLKKDVNNMTRLTSEQH